MSKKQCIENKKRLLVTMHHVHIPNGNARLSRAIDILLRSAARELEGSTNAQKGEKPAQYSPPEGAAGQSDGEKE